MDRLCSHLQSATANFGLTEVMPKILSRGGNIIIHLAPHPIVARVAAFTPDPDPHIGKKLEQELRVASHLHKEGVPVLLPVYLSHEGPFELDGHWMTFWEYVPHTALPFPSPSEAVNMVNTMTLAMGQYTGELPILGAWDRTQQSVMRLSDHPDDRIQRLIHKFYEIDQVMRSESQQLFPSHGDAHAHNLIPSPRGWLWTDFEDVSLMPRYWDLASFVANLALFKGEQEPTLQFMINRSDVVSDRKAFGLALTARILMSTLGNFDYAVLGHGDIDFACSQLELACEFIHRVEHICKGP
ncbi:aminoglycoside phosphotransferase family protein [Paenibacillus lautus]|uniref:aminoglycoside phosphotransferase family protein n=1 Tax=Paenibacillus lautus TaxID=1401 RepID=UPI000FDA50F4|nr:aminoglycoside phosphotransferase family protein [Paenibacillus lautus]